MYSPHLAFPSPQLEIFLGHYKVNAEIQKTSLYFKGLLLTTGNYFWWLYVFPGLSNHIGLQQSPFSFPLFTRPFLTDTSRPNHTQVGAPSLALLVLTPAYSPATGCHHRSGHCCWPQLSSRCLLLVTTRLPATAPQNSLGSKRWLILYVSSSTRSSPDTQWLPASLCSWRFSSEDVPSHVFRQLGMQITFSSPLLQPQAGSPREHSPVAVQANHWGILQKNTVSLLQL